MNIFDKKNQLEKELSEFITNSKSKKVIIGISGGIDSAVTLAIAVHALGKENVYALLLPYKLGDISSYENFNDAENLCKKFGVEYRAILLDSFVEPYLHLESLDIKNSKNRLILGNILARIRMTLLFSHANAFNGIVLGTCNKTEVLLGYETKFGDGAADVSVIGNLWKREVYELGKLYDLAENFSIKAPSAELYENQSDEEEMGFSYDDAESVLKNILDTTHGIPENIPETVIEKIKTMHTNSQHKREMLPTLLSIV